MKYFVIFLVLVGFTGVVTPQVFGAGENLFYGDTSFERLPVTLSHNTDAKFEIKFQYTKGAYSLSNVTATADITPQGAASFVHFHAESVDVYQNSIARIPVTVSIDDNIEYEKIFLNISYVGTGINDVQFKSSWSDSIIFDIVQNEKLFSPSELPSSQDYEFERLTGARCDGEPAICYGTFYNGTTIPVQCNYRHSCGVIQFDNDVFYQSPLKQFKAGVRIDKIQCNEPLQTILKTDGTPACVKPDSIEKLREYGWTNSKILSDELVREKLLELTGLLESGHVAEFNELRTELVAFVLLERIDAVGMNLDGINLKYTSLPGANLHNATLKGANIGNADLSNANLQDANLENANLSHTRLWGANLQGVNLQNAILDGASFRSADLSNADLQGSNLQNADLPITANLSNADLRNTKNLPISIDEAREKGAITD